MAKQEDVDKLLAEVEKLRKELGEAKVQKTEAQERANALASASPYAGISEEQPTGKTVTLSICLNPAERKESKLKWKEVEVPTYYYSIDLPTGAGLDLATNGVSYFHGQTYELDEYTLRDLKSRVARCWDHEKSVHGENPNAYRKPTNRHFRGAAAH